MKQTKKQNSFWKAPPKEHGGARAKGRGKVVRPIATKRAMHVIVRSSRATGDWSFLRQAHRGRIETLLEATARRFHVKIHRSVNVGNHLHLIVQAKRREHFQNFLRVFTQGVVFLVTGARKGRPVGKFWDALAYSRVVEWGRDWRNLLRYFEKNTFEAAGIPRARVAWWFGPRPQGLEL